MGLRVLCSLAFAGGVQINGVRLHGTLSPISLFCSAMAWYRSSGKQLVDYQTILGMAVIYAFVGSASKLLLGTPGISEPTVPQRTTGKYQILRNGDGVTSL